MINSVVSQRTTNAHVTNLLTAFLFVEIGKLRTYAVHLVDSQDNRKATAAFVISVLLFAPYKTYTRIGLCASAIHGKDNLHISTREKKNRAV